MTSAPPTRRNRILAAAATAVAAVGLTAAATTTSASAAPSKPSAGTACPWVGSTGADRQARRPGAHPDDPRREDHHGARDGRLGVHRLRPGQRPVVHSGAEAAGRPGRRTDGRHHPAAVGGRPRRVLRSVPGQAVRRGDRRRGQDQGRRRRPRPDRQHRPRPAVGPRLRVLQRGPLPHRPDRLGRHRGHPVPGRDGAGQALRRVQPGDQPQHPRRQRGRRRPDGARDLHRGVRHDRRAGQARRRRCAPTPRSTACTPARTRTSNNILKDDFGFDGFITSDWGGTHSTVASANAGMDMQMPDDTYFGAALQAGRAGRAGAAEPASTTWSPASCARSSGSACSTTRRRTRRTRRPPTPRHVATARRSPRTARCCSRTHTRPAVGRPARSTRSR